MTTSRWRQIEQLCQAALDRPAAERSAFLAGSCDGDDELRREVESLLEHSDGADGFIEDAAMDLIAKSMAADQEGRHVGERIGSYKIMAHLGTGGMGEVYLAEDKSLKRQVVLKFLPEALRLDESARRRFVREARLASAIDHPNVCTIYEIGNDGDRDFIAMQYVEGKTLKDIIDGKPVVVEKLLSYATQIAEGLDAAHENAVIHRDLKPANIMITGKGLVKILDFGLAKPFGKNGRGDNIETALTQAGTVLGTPAYMSPEQVRGVETDHRSDIFSMGAILYEMATGRSPFNRPDRGSVEVMNAVLHEDPEPPSARNPKIPPILEKIIDRALKKAPDDRYQLAVEMLVDLDNAAGKTSPTIKYIPTAATVPGTIRKKTWGLRMTVFFAIVAICLGSWFIATRSVSKASIESIAVLPFVNEGGNPDVEYLADGVTDTLIRSLSQLSNLRVKARSAVFQYKGIEAGTKKIASDLDVQAVLHGRFAQRGDQLMLSVELVDGITESQIWSKQYDRKLTEIVALQRDIARDVSNNLRMKLTGEEEQKLSKNTTDNADAYHLYLKGAFYWNKQTESAYRQAIEYYNQAIEKDPKYAMAYAGLANAYVALGIDYAKPKEAFPVAKLYAQKALDLAPELAEAHASMAAINFFYDWDWAAARSELDRFIAVNAESAEPFACTLHYLDSAGQPDDAVAEVKRIAEQHPTSIVINGEIGCSSYYAHRYDDAIASLQQTIELDPGFWSAYYNLGRSYGQKKMFKEAIAVLTKANSLSEGAPYVIAELGYANAASGNKSAAMDELRNLEKLGTGKYIDPYLKAVIYSGLGDNDKALTELETAFQNRSTWLIWAKVEPKFASLQSDPHFQDILRRVGRPQ